MEIRVKERIRRIDAWYSVSDQGVVYGGELPLAVIRGVGVNLHGERKKIAYLVARAFVPNADGREFVRHRNGDERDNRACNLEWSDSKEEKRRGRKPGVRWCKAWNQNGEVVGMWRNVSEAAVTVGVRAELIRSALYGKQKTAGGLLWRWM